LSIEPEQQRTPTPQRGGDDHVTAVKRLFQEHNRTLVSFLNARLHSEQEARDIAQEAYVRVLQLDNHGAVSFLRSYLFRVAANLAVDRLRERAVRETPEPQALFDALVDERVPDRTAIAGQQLEAVRAVAHARKLPGQCRAPPALSAGAR